jgi:hypothetical protein
MDMAGMLIKSLGIDPEEMKAKGEQIYEWVAGKIDSIDSNLGAILDSNARIEENQKRILSIMGLPENPPSILQMQITAANPQTNIAE